MRKISDQDRKDHRVDNVAKEIAIRHARVEKVKRFQPSTKTRDSGRLSSRSHKVSRRNIASKVREPNASPCLIRHSKR